MGSTGSSVGFFVGLGVLVGLGVGVSGGTCVGMGDAREACTLLLSFRVMGSTYLAIRKPSLPLTRTEYHLFPSSPVTEEKIHTRVFFFSSLILLAFLPLLMVSGVLRKRTLALVWPHRSMG